MPERASTNASSGGTDSARAGTKSHGSSRIEWVTGTVAGVQADLSSVTGQLASGADAGSVARLLDRLSLELAEAAGMLRGGGL